MGEINIYDELKKDNPKAKDLDLQIFSAALETYFEASKNIAENGVLCLHPRTGTPFENPYLKIRDSQIKIFERFPRIKSSRIVGILKTEQV